MSGTLCNQAVVNWYRPDLSEEVFVEERAVVALIVVFILIVGMMFRQQ